MCVCHNVCVYTALYSVYRAIYSAVHGTHFANMVYAQANSKHCSGCARLDLNLLKPSRIEFTQDPTPDLTLPDGEASSPTWLEYVYWAAHPTLRCLQSLLSGLGKTCRMSWGFPTKLIGCPNQLNHILQAHVVDGALTSFGCVEWESELFRGTMRARCYPFDMP